jgi:hypothetical protein
LKRLLVTSEALSFQLRTFYFYWFLFEDGKSACFSVRDFKFGGDQEQKYICTLNNVIILLRMKKNLITLILLCITTIALAQKSFEGEVVYSISVTSNTPGVTNKQFSDLLGTKMNYYMKAANYKSIFNGKLGYWSMYIDKDKKFYEKTSKNGNNLIVWNEVNINHDTVSKIDLKKNDTTILGYQCDKVVFTCKSGLQTFYFNSRFEVDPNLYINDQEGLWYAFLEKSRSLALKQVIDNRLFTLTLTAISVERKQLDDKFFELPIGIPITESKTKL